MALTFMALTQPRPDTAAAKVDGPSTVTTVDGLLGSADHKTIGRLWIGAGLVFLVAGLAVTAVIGVEATDLGQHTIVAGGSQFTQVWSLGRDLLLFGGLVPLLVGLGLHLVPLQIGAPAVAFARGAAGAFWTWLIGVILVVASYVVNGGPGGGRTDFVVLWALALGMAVAALMWAMVVLATTILGARTTGMTLERVPFATWSFLVFSLVGVLSLPVLLAELVLTYVRVRHGFVTLDATGSLTAVVDGSNLAPALYWLGVPLLGTAADAIGVHTSRPVRARTPVLVAIGSFGIIACGAGLVGFASVRPVAYDNGLLVAAIAVAALPVLAVLGLSAWSLRSGEPRLTGPLVGSLLSLLVLLLATAASLLALAEPVALFLERNSIVDIDLDRLLILSGTTFGDGIRGLVVGATVVGLIASVQHWSPKLWGRRMNPVIVHGAILTAAAGSLLWGIGAILAGVDDQPAYPVSTLGGGESVESSNLIAAVGMIVLLVGVIVWGLEVARAASSSSGSPAGGWKGATLEWATASPPELGNFTTAPVVRSATPLLDGDPLASAAGGGEPENDPENDPESREAR
jgi:heme/copper-type cytochrome/quinol oxidase subunit 1